ncbi:SipW-dependent-type signal peptide-containing protein [Rhodococcus sp. IEGM 1241]|uniref:SipW-dependent-type signal peptide-containing protein n=1 Tax=Rhodococcus sp. IEGM 1241 TaxID=3082228 RepID=UPI002954BCCD|nr:SipW-dependent-type signal peptide-containing protein [Rhodococcus sp. IEGM 1241]MDV8010696.1 SipW-dependent-type signal peptide-containing protein [Rhodococcus sp. IEGM 1241]
MSKHEEQQAPASLGTRLIRGATSGRARAIMSVGIVLGLGAVGTMAAWSDNASATSGVFSTGTMDLQINDDQGSPSYGFTTLTKSGMVPGNSISAMLPVQNKGTSAFSYTMSATASASTLAPLMKVAVYSEGAATNANNVGTCSGTLIETSKPFTSGGTVNVIAAPRPLAASTGVENLCFLVTLDPAATVDVQNQTVSATFNFNAATV